MSKPPPDWAAVRAVFERAHGLDTAAREAVLADPAWPPALVAEVRSLLAHAADSSTGFLAAPAAGAAPAARAGQRLGAWRLVAHLGTGGMGEVWRARRDDGAWQGEAAIKLLRGGTGSGALLARFAQEQRSLARLNHPHIARLHDAGLTPEGQPYFVMELVEGEPLDRAAAGRPLEQRLQWFVQLADAVSHAHRQLLVHRDLKPGNVLVDRHGQIKLLDFGIAKALDPLEGGAGDLTVDGRRPFTPHHASPEQVRGEPVGTATDIYSLGVLLYQLLTGVRPTGRQAATVAEAVRAVLEELPVRPSRLPATEAPSLATEAARRRLRGDLDAVVMKALEKAPEQRYASVDALAADLRAYLDGRPLAARPAGAAYRLGKFVRRQPWAVAAGAVGALGLAAGLAATVLQGHAAMATGLVALSGSLVLAIAQGQRAERARARAEQHVAELRRMVRDVVVEYGDAITHVPGGQARKAALLATAAETLQRLLAAGAREPDLLAEHAALHARIAGVLSAQEFNARVDLERAEHHARQAVEGFAAAAAAGPLAAADPIAWANALSVLAESAQLRHGRLEEAERLLAEAEAVLLRALEARPDGTALRRAHAEVLMRQFELLYGWARPNLGRPEDGLARIERAIAWYEVGSRGADEGAAYDQSQLGNCQSTRAMCLVRQQRWDEALEACRQACAAREEAHRRAPHNQTIKGALASDLNLLAGLHLDVGDAEGALAASRRGWQLLDELQAAEPGHESWHTQRQWLSFHHGRALRATGRASEALPVLEATEDWLQRGAPTERPEQRRVTRRLALTRLARARALHDLGEPGAEALARQALHGLRALVDEDAADRDSWLALGECELARADWHADPAACRREAAAHFERAAALRALTGVHVRLAAQAATP